MHFRRTSSGWMSKQSFIFRIRRKRAQKLEQIQSGTHGAAKTDAPAMKR